jgi:hypothetical protein
MTEIISVNSSQTNQTSQQAFDLTSPDSTNKDQTADAYLCRSDTSDLRMFLSRVVPWPDVGECQSYVGIHWTQLRQGNASISWAGRAVQSVDEAMSTIAWAQSLDDVRDIYIAMGSQKECEQAVGKSGRSYLKPIRNRQNVSALKTLYLDVDVKSGERGYSDQTVAVKALLVFCEEIGLPRPTMVISSGSGIHCHFELSRSLSPLEWQPLADALAEAARQRGLKADTQVTVDSARILRPPATFNFKSEPPKPTKIIGRVVEGSYSVERITRALEPYRNASSISAGGELNIIGPASRKFADIQNEAAAGIIPLPDLHKLRSALDFAAKNGQLATHRLHRDNALFPLAALAQEHPSLKTEIENLYHEMSALGGGDTSGNQAAFNHALHNNRVGSRTIGSLFYDMSALGWIYEPSHGLEPQKYGAAASVPSVPRPSAIDLTAPIRHRPFLYGTRLLRGEITVLAAPGGRGKSATAIATALALTAGRKLLHDTVFGAPKNVLLFSTEDGREELRRRMLAAKNHYNLTDSEIARLHVAGADEGRFTLITGPDKSAVVNQKAIDELGRLIAEVRADVVILDPLGPLVPFGINDNGLMAQLILSLKQMATAHDCAVLVLHHFKKGADGSVESISGASSIVNHARVAITVESMKMDEGAQYGVLPSELWRYFRLVDAKSNFAPPSNGDDWLKLETVHLNNPEPPIFMSGDAVQVVIPASFPAITQRGYLDVAARALVVADVVTAVAGASVPPYVNARGGAKGSSTIQALIATCISRVADRPSSDARVIAASLFEELQRDGVLAVEKVKTDQRKIRDGVVLGPKAKSDVQVV